MKFASNKAPPDWFLKKYRPGVYSRWIVVGLNHQHMYIFDVNKDKWIMAYGYVAEYSDIAKIMGLE